MRMGSIFKQNGKYRAQVELPSGPDGKRNRKLKSFETKREAQNWIAEMTHKANQGEVTNPSQKTLQDWLDEWLENHAHRNLKDSTYRRYEGLVRNHLVPGLGHHKLAELTPYYIQAFYNDKLKGGRADDKDGGLSKSSVHQMHAVLHRALREATQLQMIPNNPAASVEPPQPDDTPVEHFTEEQVHRYLETAKDLETYYPVFHTTVHTGFRRGEVLGLRWQDVDLEDGQAAIRQTLQQRDNGDLYFDTPKTNAGQRRVALTDESIRLLRAHSARQGEWRLQLGPDWPEEYDLVFRANNGQPIRPRNLYRQHKKIIEAADLPDVSFHALRHTHASLLLKAEQHPKIVKERLGHSDIKVTLDTYSHLTPNMQKEAARRLDDVLGDKTAATG